MAAFLLIHGGQHGSWCWGDVVAHLERNGHRAVAIDLPGRDGTPTTIDEGYRAASEALIALEEPAVVVAHSMGGIPAILISSSHRAQVRALVLAAAVVPTPGLNVCDDAYGPLMGQVFRRLAVITPLPPPLARWYFGHRLDHETKERIVARLNPERSDAFSTPMPDFSLQGTRCVYVITSRDRLLPIRTQLRYVTRIPGSRAVVLDSGHSVFAEHPARLAAIAQRAAEDGAALDPTLGQVLESDSTIL